MLILIATKSIKKNEASPMHTAAFEEKKKSAYSSGSIYSQLWASRPISNIRSISNI